MAQAMRCVNEIFPPRARFMWLLMTMRLSTISFAGMVRTLVAVGTVRLASMLLAIDLAAPRRGVALSCGSTNSSAACGALAGASAGIGCGLACTDVVFAMGCVAGEA